MKKLILGAGALMVALAAYGQGTVTINNRVGTEVTARFVGTADPAGTSSIGSPDYTVQFLGGPKGTAVGSLQALTPSSSTMRGAAGTATAGYFNGVTATVPGVPPGGNADVLVRLLGPSGFTQDFGPYPANGLGGDNPTGGPPLTPPNLQMGTTALTVTGGTNVPEPTTLALGALGLGALLAIRRRK
jgi:MYXO-CTERM domain-containing protein